MASIGFVCLTVCALFCIVPAIAADTGAADATDALGSVIFDDQFSSSTLDPAWTFVERSGRGRYSLTDDPGAFRYYGEGFRTGQALSWWDPVWSNDWPEGSYLIRTFAGDRWVLRSAVTYHLHGSSNGNSMGAQDPHLAIVFGNGKGPKVDIQRVVDYWYRYDALNIHLQNKEGGDPMVFPDADFKSPDDMYHTTGNEGWINHTYWYEVVRDGRQVTIGLSTDGTNFQPVRSFLLPTTTGATQRIAFYLSEWAPVGSYIDLDMVSVHELVGTDPAPLRFIDTFDDDTIDSGFWTEYDLGGPQIVETDQEIEITFPSHNTGSDFFAGIEGNCLLRGDFDIQVDYRLDTWPAQNGVRIGIGYGESIGSGGPIPSPFYLMERTSHGAPPAESGIDAYVAHFDWNGDHVQTSDTVGTLRLVRQGSAVTGYYLSSGHWVPVLTSYTTTEDARFWLRAWTADVFFCDSPVTLAFDNFVINSGELVCPQPSLNAEAGGPYDGPEGSPITLSAAGSTGDGLSTFDWDLDGDGAFDDLMTSETTVTHTWTDDFAGTIGVRVTAFDGEQDTDTATVTITNIAPDVSAVTVPGSPGVAGAALTATASFIDPGTGDTHAVSWDWGDGTTTSGTVAGGSISGEHAYASAGLYRVNVTVTDDDGGTGTGAAESSVIVYDPQGGSVTGGGWIDSPAGALTADPAGRGKLHFGFAASYQNGAPVPRGQTQATLEGGDFSFHSSSYDWLVVDGEKAQYSGSGTINGNGYYGFMLTAVDVRAGGASGQDLFRLRIWDKGTGAVVYDNQIGAEPAVDPATAISGGSIVVHGNSGARYRDINGNGRGDFTDIVLYFDQTSLIAANGPFYAVDFDYNDNGRIDFADLVWLFTTL